MDHQVIQHKCMDMARQIECTHAYLEHLAYQINHGKINEVSLIYTHILSLILLFSSYESHYTGVCCIRIYMSVSCWDLPPALMIHLIIICKSTLAITVFHVLSRLVVKLLLLKSKRHEPWSIVLVRLHKFSVVLLIFVVVRAEMFMMFIHSHAPPITIPHYYLALTPPPAFASLCAIGVGEKVERLYRETRVNAIGGGSEEVLLNLAARQSKL